MRHHCSRLLDLDSNARIPDGFTSVTAEADFLSAVLRADLVVVRGRLLCRWASRLWRGRGLDYEILVPPVQYLRSRWSGLDEQMASDLADALGPGFEFAQDLKAEDLLSALYPEADDIWLHRPSRMHYARWLMWQDQNAAEPYVVPVIADLCSSWQRWCEEREEPDLASRYAVCSGPEAQAALRQWFYIDGDAADTSQIGVFPYPVPPEWIDAARNEWAVKIVEQKGGLIRALRLDLMPRELAKAAAEETKQYFVHNPHELDPSTVKILSPYLEEAALEDLLNVVPPPVPPDLPSEPEEVLSWYVNDYLPFRRWGATTSVEAAVGRLRELNDQFRAWFTQWYAGMLASGCQEHYSVTSRSRRLRTAAPQDSVIFWVLLDGMAWSDAESVVRSVREKTPRLAVKQDAVFTLVPTVTRFAKPAIISGTAPKDVEGRSPADVFAEVFPSGVWLSENKHPKDALSRARSGDMFCWSLSEPDKTYHQKADRSTTQSKIAATLSTVSDRIAAAIGAVSPEFPLKVFLTTDHGRLLQEVRRVRQVPSGMQAQCRAAWGRSSEAFPASGTVERDDLMFLHSDRFGLAHDCAVLVEDEAFLSAGDKTGVEAFSHGGLRPEEVVVPWVEMTRDQRRPEVGCLVAGRARAGDKGMVVLSAVNASDTPLVAHRLTVRLAGRDEMDLHVSGEIPPRSGVSFNVDVEHWPTKGECEEVRVTVELMLPSGVCYEVEADARLESEELYSRQPLLDDEF